ncbi:MAG: AAA family ATPase [Candidatus Bathyarchaeia archaeon]
MLIKEVIIENFMSYEYARIPLKPGLNLICGPNGAGKSSILLAISVALGQAYTERSRKLRDLIRRGKDIARVTLILDNSPRGGRRPIPGWHSDNFQISRYLKLDGTYWYEVNFQTITKAELTEVLHGFGLNPDNMLIIMHQGMVEEFSFTSPQQKLRMLEEAVGFESYRLDVLEAQKKLSGILSEEQSLSRLVENAQTTLDYWKEEYERFKLRRELLERRSFLERERAWAQVEKQERLIEGLKDRLDRRQRRIETTLKRIQEIRESIKRLEGRRHDIEFEEKKLYASLIDAEKKASQAKALEGFLTNSARRLKPLALFLQALPQDLGKDEAKELSAYIGELETRAKEEMERRRASEEQITEVHASLSRIEKELSETLDRYLGERVSEAVLSFQREALEEEINELKVQLSEAYEEYKELTSLADKLGPRIETSRSPTEVSEELKAIETRLLSLGKISEEAEKMYQTYVRVYEDLKDKIALVSENKVRALEEVKARMAIWRGAIQRLLEEVNPEYAKILGSIGALGRVRLVNAEDVEAAGLEISVGFKGGDVVVLDAYTQSGGERSTAIMAFLLALQRHVKSPFRAVDEFDIHMDPRNREAIFGQLLSSVGESSNAQYLVITPTPLAGVGEKAHVITVQNVEGRSEVREAKKNGGGKEA